MELPVISHVFDYRVIWVFDVVLVCGWRPCFFFAVNQLVGSTCTYELICKFGILCGELRRIVMPYCYIKRNLIVITSFVFKYVGCVVLMYYCIWIFSDDM